MSLLQLPDGTRSSGCIFEPAVGLDLRDDSAQARGPTGQPPSALPGWRPDHVEGVVVQVLEHKVGAVGSHIGPAVHFNAGSPQPLLVQQCISYVLFERFMDDSPEKRCSAPR